MTFEQLQQEAAKLDTIRDTLGARLDHVLDSARINADDTVYLEKTSTDYNAIALATIVEILSYSNDAEVKAWFVGHGVKF